MSANDRVRAALNHAAYTFRQFDASDWRAMAEECARRAEKDICVDCGEDIGHVAAMRRTYPTGKPEHRLVKERWSCGVQP